jgi:hypothetical protein
MESVHYGSVIFIELAPGVCTVKKLMAEMNTSLGKVVRF